jgi:hypothetical protein
MSDDPITQLERHRRRQDAAYGAAFGHLCANYLLSLEAENRTPERAAAADPKHIVFLADLAELAATLVPPPPPPTNERALHRRDCLCHLCNPSHITWECPNCHRLSADNGKLATPACPFCGQTEGT